MRYFLANLEDILKHLVAYLSLTTCLVCVYIFVLLLCTQVFYRFSGLWLIIPTVLAVLLIAVSFQNLRKIIITFINQTLLSEDNRSQIALRDASRFMTALSDLKPLSKLLCRIVAHRLKLTGSSLLLFNESNATYTIIAGEGNGVPLIGQSVAAKHPFIQHLNHHETILKKEYLSGNSYQEIKELMNSLAAHVCLPAICRGTLVAILNFGVKKSGRPFSQAELELLATLSLQGAIAIENAKLYQNLISRTEHIQNLFSASKKITLNLDIQEKLNEITTAIHNSLAEISGCRLKLYGEIKITSGVCPAENLIAEIPLQIEDCEIGSIQIFSTLLEKLTSENLDLISIFAGQAAAAIKLSELYHELKEAQGKLVQAERLATVGKMATVVAEEIKGPLLTMQRYTAELHEKIKDESFRKNFNQLFESEVDRLDRIVNELLEYARKTKYNFVNCDIDNILADTIRLFEAELDPQKIQIEINFEKTFSLKVDAEKIARALKHLLNFFYKEIRDKNKFVISARSDFDQAYINLTCQGNLRREINLKEIFSPFNPEINSEVGFSLAISNKIITEHGGCLETCCDAAGLHFCLKLPLNL